MGRDASAGPGFRDWALLAVSILFVLGGFAILPSDRNIAIANIAFFGVAAGVFAMNIRRAFRDRHAHEIVDVQVVGGAPIRESRKRAATLGAILAALGSILLAVGGAMGPILLACVGFIAFVGFVILLGVATRRIAVAFILFEADGLSLSRRQWSYRVPWDDIVEVGTMDLHRNTFLLLRLRVPDGLVVAPPGAEPAVRRHFASNTRWVGAPVAIMASNYAIDPPVLAHAVERYVRNPSARAELGRRLVT